MTALETLQKYGLKTDLESVKDRMNHPQGNYWTIAITSPHAKDEHPDHDSDEHYWRWEARSLYVADLSLLCSLAEKGERYEKAVKDRKQEAQRFIHTMYEFYGNTRFWGVTIFKEHIKVIDKIITEAEGKGK